MLAIGVKIVHVHFDVLNANFCGCVKVSFLFMVHIELFLRIVVLDIQMFSGTCCVAVKH